MDRQQSEIKDCKSLIKYHQSCLDRHKRGLGLAHRKLEEARNPLLVLCGQCGRVVRHS